MDQLTVKDLHKQYEGKPLLYGVSFSVNTGETLCLLGASGSGKSTILRIIAGIETPESGSVIWNGQEMNNVPVYQRNFGLMFQDYALFPHLNVEENVAFGLRMQKTPTNQVKERVYAALDRVNMTGFGMRRVTDLSGGEQQRIALARALAPQPRLLMLDEPLAALDRGTRLELQEELRNVLHAAGIPVIYVTHDQEEAIVVSDRLALLNEGRIVQCAATESVFATPRNRWVAAFLGMTNLLGGTVVTESPFTVSTDCGVFEATPPMEMQTPSVGSQVTLLIKPTGSSEGANSHRVTGRVVVSAFRGDHYRLRLEVCTGIQLEFSSPRGAQISEMLSIPLSPQDVICLED